MAERRQIDEYTKCTILDMSGKVLEHIAANHEMVREGVKSVMGGQVLEYEAKRIRNEGIERGLEQGLAEGLCSMIKTVRLLVGDDFAKVCEIIRENEIYAQTSDEEIRKYWD